MIETLGLRDLLQVHINRLESTGDDLGGTSGSSFGRWGNDANIAESKCLGG